jgi:hypothetical protein
MYAQIVLYTTCTMYLISYMDIVHCQTTFSSPGYRIALTRCITSVTLDLSFLCLSLVDNRKIATEGVID